MKSIPLKRDGVWENQGLKSDFKLLYEHPHAPNIYRVLTAAGEAYAPGQELSWDCFAPEIRGQRAEIRGIYDNGR